MGLMTIAMVVLTKAIFVRPGELAMRGNACPPATTMASAATIRRTPSVPTVPAFPGAVCRRVRGRARSAPRRDVVTYVETLSVRTAKSAMPASVV